MLYKISRCNSRAGWKSFSSTSGLNNLDTLTNVKFPKTKFNVRPILLVIRLYCSNLWNCLKLFNTSQNWLFATWVIKAGVLKSPKKRTFSCWNKSSLPRSSNINLYSLHEMEGGMYMSKMDKFLFLKVMLMPTISRSTYLLVTMLFFFNFTASQW